jgi:hypothetical protein
MTDDDNALVICEDSFFSLSYTLHYNGTYQTSLSHRCNTDDTYNWSWRWSIFNECHICGVDIPYDLMRTWRMFLMLDEVELDSDFVQKVYYPFTEEEREVLYWRKIRYI